MQTEKRRKFGRKQIRISACCILLCGCIAFAIPIGSADWSQTTVSPQAVNTDGVISWVDFTIPCEAMERAMNYDIETHNTETPIDWIAVLAYLGAKYGGEFSRYRQKDMMIFDEPVFRAVFQDPEAMLGIPVFLAYFGGRGIQ